MKKFYFSLFSCAFILFNASAQVGIGTVPDPSAILDISSTTGGMLAPRLTTAEKMAISSPAESLLVFDTDEKAFFYYDTTSSIWVKILSGSGSGDTFEYRNNWKLIKSDADLADELTAGGGTEYLLDENIMYEINGTIALSYPINLNNAYLTGQDSGEDILLKAHAGAMFQGSGGGTIQKLVLTSHPSIPAGSIFNLVGTGMADPLSFLLFRDVIVKDNASVGSISNFNLVFFSIIQFIGNTNGITYSNISSLLLQNQGWSGSSGTFETLTGNFGLFQKASGFSVANGTAVALDLSANPVISTKAVMLGTVFTGSSTQPFVKPYTMAAADTYPDYNFTADWTVNCPGIIAESDGEAFGNVFLTSSAPTMFTATEQAMKVAGTTTSVKHFRTGTGAQSNRIVYTGRAKRQFFLSASMTVDADNRRLLRFFIAKNGVLIESTGISTFVVGNGDIKGLAFTGTVDLSPNDYIELWAVNKSSSSSVTLTVEALNMLIY